MCTTSPDRKRNGTVRGRSGSVICGVCQNWMSTPWALRGEMKAVMSPSPAV